MLVAALSLQSCSDDDNAAPKATFLDVFRDSTAIDQLRFQIPASYAIIGIDCDGDWTASVADESWVTISNHAGYGSATKRSYVKVSVAKNEGDLRTNSITITSGSVSKTINIEQSGTGLDPNDPFESSYSFVMNMGLGYNLGNTLDANPVGSWWDPVGKTPTDYETSWGQPVTTPEIINAIAEKGFKVIRVPVTWGPHADENDIINDAWMNRVEEVVNYVLNAGCYCILNIQHDSGTDGWLCADPVNYTTISARFQKFWNQIATRFQKYDDKLLFEAFNEILDTNNTWGDPTDPAAYDVVNKLEQDFVNTVRATGGNNEFRNLVVNTYSSGHTAAKLAGFAVPADVHPNHILASIHCYDPYNFCNNNEGRYTYTKYQMNWPGNGDPYYTEEGGVRRTYYSVNAVPMAFLDAESLNFNNVQNQFNQHAEIPAFMDIKGSFSVEGNNITVLADIMPYINANARIYISVNEKETHGNVGSNGETSFHHVFMKMLPDAQGTTVDFVSGELQHLEFTQDMSGTHVEEMSDLEVSIWVQNYSTQEIFNSRYAYEYTNVHPYPVENLTLTEVAGPRGLFEATWDAPTNGNPIGYDVYVNNVLVAENTTETEYSFEGESGVFYVAGVVAKYPDDMNSVKVLASASSNLQDMGLYIPGSPNVDLTFDEPEAEVYVTNGNFATHTPIEITAITETNSTGEQYLVIEHTTTLPTTIEAGDKFYFNISPNAPAGRSVAETFIKVESDGGEVLFNVTIDGELLSISEISSTAKVYPNPANDQVRIVANNSIESVMVYNMMGALVETIPANGMSMNVNLSQYSNGVYFFNIRQSDGTVSNQRVVVSH